MINSTLKLLGVIGLYIFLVACSDVTEKHDSAPSKAPDVANIPDAVPKDEPRSKYGNASSYEVFGKRYYTLKSSKGYQQKGVASWYGTKFHGRRTSSGEPYDMYAMTAAHKTLPLPTYVEVTNLDNGRKVIVKVNDRGPFHGDRLIDLSYSAATKLDIISKGTGKVEVRAITAGQAPVKSASPVRSPEKSSPVGLYLQVGAFKTSSSAEQMRTKLQQQISDAILIVPLKKPDGHLYRVRVGPLENVEYGDALASRLVDLGFNDTHIVVE
ncbi:MAG: septal ring lytic transglycosylase RlpA family lipoprotein [Gammaproteobacteria bacterium]|nr:MAG: septal ring lytic transglycosylase RlpA family lipoprotein [Gammaproteobacteria bacterium]RKZ95553.1 MAG: septal ring lytic transglycosylase RlpA family lipoprotein [Gammaproteobacteria bacterium]RKZ97714.1 MAG: septal ring lytic transglycosylase RlpA family lipoprotein [Gammaproteobacteria bacterium]HHA18375.1 septal ring lytic transglycosylase RlpA family protein [Methylophaga sp.]